MKIYGVIILTFVFVVVGFSLFYTQPASAASYTISKDYYVYKKSNNYLYYDGTNSTYAIINWTPQINITKNKCDANPAGGQKNFDPATPIKYMNCTGLGIQEVRSGSNNLWFENANYAYIIGDVDWSETVSVGGGVIAKHGASTNNPTNGSRDILAKVGATKANGDCDNPNPHFSNDCSILIMFNHSHPGDFGITLNNNLHSSGHEYWYDFQVLSHYRTLTFNPNGGSVADTSPGVALWPHTSGSNALREYEMGDTARNYPTPTWPDNTKTFQGWYTAPSGGSLANSTRVMNTDETYYAHWVPVAQWSVSPASEVTSSGNRPGDTINWRHTVINNGGKDPTNVDVNYHWQNRGGLDNSIAGSNTTVSPPLANGATATPAILSSHLVTQDDVGKNLCRSTIATPQAWNNGASIESAAACVSVPYNYVLTPTISLNVSGAVESGTSVNVTPSVANRGPTRSKNTNWQLTQMVVNPSITPPHSNSTGSSPSAPCVAYFVASGVACTTLPGGSGASVFSETGSWLSGTVLAAIAAIVGDYPPGTKICYALSLQPHSSSDNLWIHSAPDCLYIGKRPKTQIWAGDLLVGGNVKTSTSTKSGNTYGSWAEYGIVASGGISGAASGAAYAGPSNATGCDARKLSFTNAGNSTCGTSTPVGYYSSTTEIPDVGASFPGGGSLPSNPVSPESDNLDGVYNINTDIILNASLNLDKSVIIKAPNNTVTITGNQTYRPGPYTSISQLPQLVIIAKNINIVDTVTNIDAWLIAKNGLINTCSSVSGATLAVNAGLSTGICNSVLRVNGPVMTKELYLRRTAGSDAVDSAAPAEIFNLRADAYLWAISYATSKTYIQTVHSTELPPRY